MAKKVLNLSGSRAAPTKESSSESGHSSGSEDEQPRKHHTAAASEQSGTDDDSESEDEEFEIPPGFESVQGSSTITRESILAGDKELWFFKLPKDLDASALANVSFKLGKDVASAGALVSSVSHDGKSYNLQAEDALLTNQLVNAFPLAKERKKFTLGKPFTRCFSLVEDRTSAVATKEKEKKETPTKKKSKSSKKHQAEEVAEPSAKPAKKAKTKK